MTTKSLICPFSGASAEVRPGGHGPEPANHCGGHGHGQVGHGHSHGTIDPTKNKNCFFKQEE